MIIAAEEKLNKLESILKMMDENISREEFVKSFEQVVKFVLEIRQKNEAEMEKLKAGYAQVIEQAKEEITAFTLNEPKEKLKKLIQKTENELEVKMNKIEKEYNAEFQTIKRLEIIISKALKNQEDGLNFLRDKVRGLKNGEKGEAGKDGSSDAPEQIRDKLEKLKDKEKLDISAIRGLEDWEEVKRSAKEGRNIIVRGGGGSNAWIHQSFSVNSGTTTITLSNAVSAGGLAIFCYYNGQFVVRGTHYTMADNAKVLTLTFTPDDNSNFDTVYMISKRIL